MGDEKLKVAKENGADETINSKNEDPVSKVMELTNKKGADGVIDFVNASKTVETDMQLLRKRAKVVLVGLFGGELKLNLVSMPTRAYSIIGSYTGNIQDMAELVSLANRKVIKPVISDRFKLSEVYRCIDKVKRRQNYRQRCYKSLTIKTINPSTAQVIQEYENITKEDLTSKTKKAKEAFEEWKKDSHKRTDYIYEFARQFRKDKENLAKIATMEMGKAIKESRAEVEKCAWAMEYFADNGLLFKTDEVINADARKTVVKFEPIGAIGSIMPWNFPYWQALRFAAPSLVIGNTIVLKPSSVTMQCGIEIEKAFSKVGLPEGVFQTLVGDSSIADTLIESKYISGITFTGSVAVGSKVAQRATSKIKKTVLE